METAGKPYYNFIFTVSDIKSIKSEKIDIKSGFSKYKENILKDEVKNEISDFKIILDLYESFIKNNISMKNEQEKVEELTSTLADPVRVVERTDDSISNNGTDKISVEEKIFMFSETKNLELTWQLGALFYTNGIKAGAGIESSAVKWNKTIDKVGMKPFVKNLSAKSKLEDSDEKDQLYLKY